MFQRVGTYSHHRYTTNQTTQSSLLSTATSDVLSATSNALSDASNVPVSATSTHALDDQTIGIIVGTVSGSISGLILLGLLVMMCWRRRRLSQIRRSHNSSFGGTFRSSSVQQQAQNGHDQGLSYGQDSFSKYPDPIKTFPIPQRADPLAARIGQSLQADSPYSHLELNPREENHWYVNAASLFRNKFTEFVKACRGNGQLELAQRKSSAFILAELSKIGTSSKIVLSTLRNSLFIVTLSLCMYVVVTVRVSLQIYL